MMKQLIRARFYKLIAVFPMLLIWSVGYAQHEVTGTVVDANDQEPLVGVSIVVQGTTLGTSTDIDGAFELTVPNEEATLVISYIGYTTLTLPLDGRSHLEIEMESHIVLGEELIVIGYGTQRTESVTGSVASVSTQEMQRIPVPTTEHALQGMAPGLQIIDGGHWPGHNQLDILIRGQGSLGRGDNIGSAHAARPLIIVDGVEGNLSNININDVERISVLKDASASAIYGSRAANGVILVTTKRGDARGLQIEYNGYSGIQDITAWPERVDTETHMRLANLARANLLQWCLDGRDPSAETAADCYANPSYTPRYSDEYIQNTLAGTDPDAYPSDELVDEIFNRAPIHDHSLRISGGDEFARYALSLNYMDESGMMANSGTNRYGVRLNTNFQATDQLSGALDLSASRRWDIQPDQTWASIFYIIHDTPPTRRVRYSDGTYGLNLFGRSSLASAEVSGTRERVFWDGVVTGRVNYEIIPDWVELRTLVSYDYGSMDYDHFRTDPRLIPEYPDAGYNWGPSYGDKRDFTTRQTTIQGIAEFDQTFQNIHEVSGILGYEQVNHVFEEFRASRDQFYNNELRHLDLASSANASNRGFGSEWALRSVFGRINYALMDRYLFEFNSRYDGSSRFAEGHQFGFFPSFSLGWRISEEPFFNIDWIDEFRLRGSWGQLGNQDVPLYQYYSSINLNIPYYIGNSTGAQTTGGAAADLINEELSWETTTVINYGFDSAFLEDRLSFSAEMYTRHTEDILLALSIPDMVGLNAPFQNAGVVENKGWELKVGWQDVVGDFSYGIDFNLSDNKNEVIDLYGTGPYIMGGDADQIVAEGLPINSWYGFEVEGLFSSYEQIDAHADLPGWVTRLGDLMFVDQNNDGIINDEDRVVIGDPNPRYIFGMNINMGWRNIDFSAFVHGVGKRDQYLSLGFIQGPVWENYTSQWHNDYWTPDNQDARHPAYYANYNRNYYTSNSWWIMDGSFVKLRNVQIGYTLPENIVQRLGIENVRIFATGKNLWMKTGYEIDLDPEYPWTRADYYPQTKVISLGANVRF